MRVLVTGGLGFTGSALVAELLGHGHNVTVLTSSPGRVPPGEARLIRADLRDRAAISRLVAAERFDGVCHLAARTRIRDSVADPIGYFDVNVTGTLNLLAALDDALDGAGPPPRVVFASTGAVYGPRDGVLAEDEPAAPANPYGASKLAAEQALTFQAATGALAAVSLRCFNIAGGFTTSGGAGTVTDHDLTRIIPKTLAVAAGTADRLQINGDGGAVREYTHVLDVARAFELALDAAVAGQHLVLNVGSGIGVTVAELVAMARQVTGRPIPAEHLPPKPEAQTVMADSTRIRAELGWDAKHSSLEQIISDAWAATTR